MDKACYWSILLTALTLCGIGLVCSVEPVSAQPTCPPGFQFEPLSGVGCIQTNCLSIDNAYFDSTGHCICNEGFQTCSIPIDATFNFTLCGPFCPINEVISCVLSPSLCPDEISAGLQLTENASSDSVIPVQPNPDNAEQDTNREVTEISAAELVKNLEEFLAGSDNPDVNSRDAAVAAAATAALLAAWIASQLAAGIKLDKIMEAVNLQQDKSIEAARNTAEQSRDDAVVVDKDAVEGSDTATSKMTEPRDLDLREARLRELVSQFLEKEKIHRVELEKARKDLKATSEQVKLLDAQFNAVNKTRCTDAIVEIVDTVLMASKDVLTLGEYETLQNLREKFPDLIKSDQYKDFVYKKFQENVSDAYRKDFIKNLIKTVLAKDHANDSGVSPKDMVELVRKPFGVKALPGGALKEMIIQVLKMVPIVGKVSGKSYDYFEQIYGGVSEYQEHTKTLHNLLKQYSQQLEKQLKLEDQVHTHQVEGDFAHRRRVTVLQSLGEHLQKKTNTPVIRTR